MDSLMDTLNMIGQGTLCRKCFIAEFTTMTDSLMDTIYMEGQTLLRYKSFITQ